MSFLRKHRITSPSGPDAPAGGFQASAESRASIDTDGIALFHLSSGLIFRANRIGAIIWQGVRDKQTVQNIAAGISREHGVSLGQAEQDTTAFIAELRAQKFLVES